MQPRSSNTRIVIGPNASLSPRQALAFMALIASVSLAIAAFFALQGLWPILPFAGLELAALGTALVVVLKRNRYREVLHFDGEIIRLEIGMIGIGASATVELLRSRTRVLLERGPHRHDPLRLRLSDAGRMVDVARCVTDAERVRLAARMRELIHPGWRGASDGSAAEVPPAAWWH